jgi:outer membrane murein-binding lipoprotein Lpp
MVMRHSNWLAAALVVGTSALALAGCHRTETAKTERHERAMRREPIRAISKLDCPAKQGQLKLVSAAADGLSCAYTGEAEVVLRLVSLNGGDAEAALAPIETELKALMPTVKAAEQTGATAKSGKNKTSIHLPGVHIDASDDGADIKIGHITINSSEGGASEVKINKNVTVKGDDRKETVNISAHDDEDGDGDVNIRASDDGAEIRHNKRGDAIRSTLILASDKAPSGYRVVGYEARGPKGGPIAVATVKAKNRDEGDHDIFKDMKALVRHNVGG